MRPARITALVVGCLLVIPSVALLFGGGALGLGYAFGRGDDGYFDATLDRLETATVAITAEDITFAADPGSPDWVLDTLDADVRLRVTSTDNTTDVFVGIGRQAEVAAYLAGVAHDEVTELSDGLEPVYTARNGGTDVSAPGDMTFWVASAAGPGTQEVTWEATSGSWSVVVMNADATTGVAADVNVGLKAAFVLPLALIMLGAGVLLTAAAVVLIVTGAHGPQVSAPTGPEPELGAAPPVPTVPTADHPVVLEATLDPAVSRWLWLVKWFLAIPHFIVLVALATAFVVLTLVAGVAILFTGRYPQGIFDFNVGVLRWAWRVTHYATTGGIGTDRYPPFSLRPEPGDAARLDIAYPDQLSRGLVLVKWFLAIPHIIIVAVLAGASIRWLPFDGDRVAFDPTGGGGLLGLLVLAAGIMLLFTGRYPPALFALIVGFNRWIYRVIAYIALMTDQYPPFRLDQGGAQSMPMPPEPDLPPVDTIDLHTSPDAQRQHSTP